MFLIYIITIFLTKSPYQSLFLVQSILAPLENMIKLENVRKKCIRKENHYYHVNVII